MKTRYLFGVVAVLLSGVFFNQTSFAGKCETGNAICGNPGQQPAAQSSDPGRENGWLFRYRRNIIPYVPSDLVYLDPSNTTTYTCDENGNPIHRTTVRTCQDFASTGEHSKWRLLYVEQGAVQKIFRVKHSGIALHVEFASDGRPSMVSPEAERIAQTNGYKLDPRTNTMVAANDRGANQDRSTQTVNSRTVQPENVQDCSQVKGFMAKARCIKDGAAALGVTK